MLLWWNYPVNDYCKDNLLTDGVKGLSVDLKDSIRGVISNPMNQAEASKLPLATLADYLRNPIEYSYEDSYEKALRELYPKTHESVKMLFENSYASNINFGIDSLRFKKLISDFENEYNIGVIGGSVTNELLTEFNRLKKAVYDIETNTINEKFIKEILPWLKKAKHMANMGIYFIGALTSDSEKEFWENFRQYNDEKLIFDEITANVSRNVVAPFISGKAKSILEDIGPKSTISMFNFLKTNVVRCKANALASLKCCENNKIENAVDNNANTFYWSCTSARKNFWIMIDLGKQQKVNNIVLKSGCSPSGLDYIRNGQMQYSNDEQQWVDIGETQTKKLVALSGLDIECRYIRYISNTNQDYWMSVSEFSANVIVANEDVFGQPNGAYNREAIRMVDGNLSTFYKSEIIPSAGERITFNTSNIEFSKLLFLQSSLCGADVIMFTGGKESYLGTLDEYYKIVALPLGMAADKVILEFRNENIPIINEVIFR